MVVVGTGGFATEVHDTIVALNLVDQIECFDVSNKEQQKSGSFRDIPVKLLSEMNLEGKQAVLDYGDPMSSAKFVGSCADSIDLLNIIHPSAIVSPFGKLGKGNIIGSQANINADAVIGDHVIVNRQVAIGHDSKIVAYSQLGPGCVLSGNVTLGKNVFIGAQSAIRERIKISDNIVVGMGAIVVRDSEIEGVYVGNPTKLKQ